MCRSIIPFQILPWSKVKHLENIDEVCRITTDDFRDFELPIPGVWKTIMASEATPGLPSQKRGKYKGGPINSDLEMLAISDEYWFSWKGIHPGSQLIRLQ